MRPGLVLAAWAFCFLGNDRDLAWGQTQGSSDQRFAAEVAEGIAQMKPYADEDVLASSNCVRLGGVVRVVYGPTRSPDKVCAFDHAVVSTFSLYQATALHRTVAAIDFFLNRRVDMPPYDGSYNPSWRYCTLAGGRTVPLNDAQGEPALMLCRFPDTSAVEAWTLLRGTGHEANRRLVAALRP